MKSEATKQEIEKVKAQIKNLEAIKSNLIGRLLLEITDESGFKYGEIVEVVSHRGETQKGFFAGFRFQYEIAIPVIFKLKKDGSPSKNEFWMSYCEMKKIQK